MPHSPGIVRWMFDLHQGRAWTLAAFSAALLLTASAAKSGEANSADPLFGNRTENRDGSVAMTVGRKLPTDWESKIGTDVKLANPTTSSLSETMQRGVPADRSSGSIWGSITMPGITPYSWDKTALEARLDTADDHRKIGTTLSRSVPLGSGVSVTVRNSYSVTQPLPETQTIAPGAAPGSEASTWATDQSLRFNIDSSGTALVAGGGTTSTDEQWHKRFSVEQTLFGPLKVTTSVEDPGSATGKKSVSAGFKRTW
jgi:hypothetical protein